MTPTEAAALLTVCSGLDNRKPTAEAAQLWAEILGDLPLADCRAAVVAHYRESREWLMPADIVRLVRAGRRQRVEAFDRAVNLTPPSELDGEQQREWRMQIRERVARGEVDAETWLAENPDDKFRALQNGPWSETQADRDAADDARRLFMEARRRGIEYAPLPRPEDVP